MRLGLIARCEIARGIAIQSKGFYDHMPVDKVLLVRMPRPDCAEAVDWYEDAVTTHALYDMKTHQLDERTVRNWLYGLDVVFTVETPNDWRIPTWCREAGVKLVIQGNPEFVRHGRPGYEQVPHPDAWWWPTRWREDLLPAGVHMPVPMPTVTTGVMRSPADRPLHVLHVVGKRAFGDRNGTDIFIQALRRVRRPMHVTIYGLDGELPKVPINVGNPGLTVEYHPDGTTNRWTMYTNQDVLVLPRRYGGLCLPALEASACGLAVMMTDCPPNDELAYLRVSVRRWQTMVLACGPVQTADAAPIDIAARLDDLADQPDTVAFAQTEQAKLVTRWGDARQHHLDELQKVIDS